MTCGCGDTKDFCVRAGATFHPAIRWGGPDLTSIVVSNVSRTAPVVITAPGHGVPDGWPVALTGVQGIFQINAANYPPRGPDWEKSTFLSVDTLALNSVSTADSPLSYQANTGYLVYQTPIDLTGYTASMQIWDNPQRMGLPILTLSDTAGIAIDLVDHTITPELQTAMLTWTLGYYTLALTAPDGIVSEILTGRITIQ